MAAITQYEVDDGGTVVVCQHKGDGVWLIYNKRDETECFEVLWEHQEYDSQHALKRLLDMAKELHRLVKDREAAEKVIRVRNAAIKKLMIRRENYYADFWFWCRAVQFQQLMDCAFPWTMSEDGRFALSA